MHARGWWKMNRRQPSVRGRESRWRTGQQRLTATLALPLLLGLGAVVASAQHHGDDGMNSHTMRKVREPSPTALPSTAAALPPAGSPNQHMMQAQAVKTTAMTATTTPAANILPPVPATAFIQVPPVPADPFAPPPVALAPPPPVSKPMAVGLSAAPAYQVNCVLPGGSYCRFTNSFFVTSGSICHCGTAAGKTE